MTIETTTTYRPETVAALNVLMDTDAYKLDHRRQYPAGTEYVYSNLTARGSRTCCSSTAAVGSTGEGIDSLGQSYRRPAGSGIRRGCYGGHPPGIVHQGG